jgi:hypothetical protein
MKLFDIILNEGINDNIGKISLTYTNYARPYKMEVDGKRISFDEMKELILGLTGLELPSRAYYSNTEVLKILNALKEKGIEADSWEMDVD